MNNMELQHFGVLGMRWGKRKTPKEIAERKIAKIEKKNEKWEKKKVKAHKKIAKAAKKFSKFDNKFNKGIVDTFESGLSRKHVKRVKKFARKLKKWNKRNKKWTKRLAKYEKKMYKNKIMLKTLNSKLSAINQSTINNGKAMVDAALKED